MSEHSYNGMKRTLPISVDTADARVRAALKDEGFGVLTEIDVRSTLKEKIGADFRPYRILGACNPSLAHQALSTELDIGLLLPCNVVVYEDGEGSSTVSIMDPVRQLEVAGRDDLGPVAADVRQRMQRVLAAL